MGTLSNEDLARFIAPCGGGGTEREVEVSAENNVSASSEVPVGLELDDSELLFIEELAGNRDYFDSDEFFRLEYGSSKSCIDVEGRNFKDIDQVEPEDLDFAWKGGRDDSCLEDKDRQPAGSSKDSIPRVPFYKMYAFADPLDYLLMAIGTLGAVVHGLAVPVYFYFFGRLVDAFGENYANPSSMASEVSTYSLYLLYLALVVLGAAWLEVSCWMHSGERQSAKIRIKYLKSILVQDVGFFDTDMCVGEIVNQISSDILIIQDAISEKAGNLIHFLARFIGGLVAGFVAVWQLALITVAVVPAIALAGGAYAVSLINTAAKSQKANEEAGKIAEQVIAQVRTVYSFGGEARAAKAYSDALQPTLRLGKRAGLVKGLGIGVTYGLVLCAWALLLWYAGVLIRHGMSDAGKAFTTILNIVVSGFSLGQAFSNFPALAEGRAAASNIIQMVKRRPAMLHNQGGRLEEVYGDIELRNICFSYPSRPESLVLKDFSLMVPAGKTIAIIGSSGSGKSTVVSLIERFYDPLSGDVLLDGTNIKYLELQWLRKQIGLVSQEPILFATTIRENLLYSKEDATMEELIEVSKASNAHEFIDLFPEGYETQVGERGVQLSGGEKQRVALARAMLKNPKILLLDEATSALDTGSQQLVQDALDRFRVGRTTVVIAHQLSTIRHADSIAVVHHGRIVEMGTHEELLAKGEKGAYAALSKLQDTGLFLVQMAENMATIATRKSGTWFVCRLSDEFSSEESCFDLDLGANQAVEEPEGPRPPRPSIWRLMQLNKPEWPYALLGTIGAIISGCEFPLFALAITQVLITFYSPDKEFLKKEVSKFSLILTGSTICVVFSHMLQHYSFGAMGESLTKRVREMMFLGILNNEISWFDEEDNRCGLVASRLASDATMVRVVIADRMSTIVQNLALMFVAFFIAYVLEWRVAVVITATFPLLLIALVGEQMFLKGFSGDLSKAYSRASTVASEAVGNIRTVAAFCSEKKVIDSFVRELQVPKRKVFLRGHVAGVCYGISQFFLYTSYALGLWYSSVLIKKGVTGFANAIKTFMVIIITAFGVAETLATAPDLIKGSQALYAVFEIMDRKGQINPNTRAMEISNVKGDVDFRHVEFSYPARKDVVIFRDLSLRIRAGKSLALVGASGSGKSSVVALIQRFYDPVSGYIMIDGKNIRSLNLQSLRRHIGLVQQEPALFSCSIYENILYGKEGASEAEIVQAAKTANAHGFISSLPNGYQTQVGERGVQLSGGQKQRVAIARAVLKCPAILLLDEATSALDAHSEKQVQEALDRVMRGRTTLIVAHRFSAIRNADIIAVVQDGTVVEQGSPKELLSNRNSAYFQLVKLHARHRTSKLEIL
ncbi:ABC transporter B family member 19 [Selaginella moellendorffii]|uniref:ABC transporter B family member 19 n=1 Tax=Selaginella moellendorffii TaxID=88036 RepID=UPI000D1C9B90|nr:ABC transporter B family member 19 [Selaginella moellendorffii]|eukprot:XP_024522226.1 ABC transporter B family member 19 [Selaginella moellendorffii]